MYFFRRFRSCDMCGTKIISTLQSHFCFSERKYHNVSRTKWGNSLILDFAEYSSVTPSKKFAFVIEFSSWPNLISLREQYPFSYQILFAFQYVQRLKLWRKTLIIINLFNPFILKSRHSSVGRYFFAWKTAWSYRKNLFLMKNISCMRDKSLKQFLIS